MGQKYRRILPQGAGVLFLIQLFSALSYSVLYSTLILYVTRTLQFSDGAALRLTGAFVALYYFLHLLGGYLGGRNLSYRSLFAISMVLQIFGCALISIAHTSYLLWGLAIFLSGAGINVTCINCMVTQLFAPDDKRREAAFMWNYSGMNLGFFAGFALAGFYQLLGNYHELFLLSGLANAIALLFTLVNWQLLPDRDTLFSDSTAHDRENGKLIGIGVIVTLIFTLRVLLDYTNACNGFMLFIGIAMFALLTLMSGSQTGLDERGKMRGFLILAFSAFIFWSLYQLAPMALTLFIARNVDKHFLGYLLAPQWVQNINTLVIIIGGPLLGTLFSQLRERGHNINIPLQFSVGLFLIGIAFIILPIGISHADGQGYTSFSWIVASCILQSTAGIFISSIGYAVVGQLAPQRLRGLMMGIWMMITSIAAIFSNYLSNFAIGSTDSLDPLITNPSYSITFSVLGFSVIAAGAILFAFIPTISRLIRDKHAPQTTKIVTENLYA